MSEWEDKKEQIMMIMRMLIIVTVKKVSVKRQSNRKRGQRTKDKEWQENDGCGNYGYL